MTDIDERIQVSALGDTVWVHQFDGSTVGRFSKRFGMDVHNTVSDQLEGLPQCLNCTHQPAGHQDWLEFCRLIKLHFQIDVPLDAITFADQKAGRTSLGGSVGPKGLAHVAQEQTAF